FAGGPGLDPGGQPDRQDHPDRTQRPDPRRLRHHGELPEQRRGPDDEGIGRHRGDRRRPFGNPAGTGQLAMTTSFSGIYSSLTGMLGFSTALDVTSENISNLNTPGFKSNETLFRDLGSFQAGNGPKFGSFE